MTNSRLFANEDSLANSIFAGPPRFVAKEHDLRMEAELREHLLILQPVYSFISIAFLSCVVMMGVYTVDRDDTVIPDRLLAFAVHKIRYSILCERLCGLRQGCRPWSP